MTYAEMLAATRDAVGARDQARADLARHLKMMIDDAMSVLGVRTIEVGGYRVAWVDASAECSQWGDGSYPVVHTEMVTLITRRLQTGEDLARSFTAVNLGYWDGRNMQHQLGRAAHGGVEIRPATVAMLRTIAAALPAVIAQSLADRQQRMAAETGAAREALAAL